MVNVSNLNFKKQRTYKMKKINIENNILIFECPNCDGMVEVNLNDINCSIFRHGYYFVKNGKENILLAPVNPHETKSICDKLIEENKIYGCGKPFQIVKNDNTYYVKTCDYI